jgi:dTDP-4-dehydrorhamnose reductase
MTRGRISLGDGRRMLVFGRSGQVATELAARAAGAGWRVHAVGRPEVDIRDEAAVHHALAQAPWACVVNAAGYTAVDQAETEPEHAHAVNERGAAHVATACALRGTPLLHLSTDYVFDGTLTGRAYREDDPIGPLGVYARSKAAGEAVVRVFCPDHVIVRTAWLHGPHGHNFVKTMIRLASERNEIRVVDDQIGNPTAVVDVADILFRVADHVLRERSGFGTYHYAGGGETTWHGVAQAVFGHMARAGRRTPRLVPISTGEYPAAAIRPANSRLDCSRISEVFGITSRPWQDGLADSLAVLGILSSHAQPAQRIRSGPSGDG